MRREWNATKPAGRCANAWRSKPYVRQLENRHLWSIGAIIEGRALDAYASLCGRMLARAHARGGDLLASFAMARRSR